MLVPLRSFHSEGAEGFKSENLFSEFAILSKYVQNTEK